VTNRMILIVALAAAIIGAIAGLRFNGPGLLLGSEPGQRALQQLAAAGAPPPPEGLEVAARGDRIPALELPALDGSAVRLPDGSGRPLLINYWASWCSPCIEEMPELDRFAASQGPDGVQVVGIALDDADAVRTFLQQVPVGYRILLDQPGPADTSVQLGNPAGVLPFTVLVDGNGVLQGQRIGPFRDGEVDGWVGGQIQTRD